MSLTVTPESGETDVLGKTVSELQSGVTISGSTISGTLNPVDDYTGFSGNVAEQSGHYLVLKATTENASDTITVELVGGTVGHPVTLDSDRNIVLRIANPSTQSVRVVATNGTSTVTKTYSLTGLTLAEE